MSGLTARAPRTLMVIIATLGLISVMFAAPVSATPDPKVFVCKYVSTPGEGERLQTGDNPTNPSVNAIKAFKDFEGPIEDLVGESFSDDQGRSLVIAIDTGQEEPSAEDCPPPGETPTPSLFAVPCTETANVPTIRLVAAGLLGLRLFVDDVERTGDLVNGDLAIAPGSYTVSVRTAANIVLLEQQVTVAPCTTTEPPTPTLVVDKAADTELIEILDDVATPSVVTWTLTYTLTDGPVTDAVITDEIPVGFTFLDAANGGTEAGGVVTWILASPLEASGSVSFRTTVDVANISRTGATENTATIVSNETPEDDGQDSVTVTDEDTLGGNPTPTPPAPVVPDTAMGAGIDQVPAALLSLLLMAGLGTMLYLRLSRQR